VMKGVGMERLVVRVRWALPVKTRGQLAATAVLR
jgi:hypothetical protein